VLGIFANDHYFAFALNNLALFAHFLYRRFYFHFLPPFRLLCSESYSSLGKVIDRYFDRYLITGYYFYIVHTHFTGNMRCYYVSVCKFYFEHGIGQYFSYDALAFDYVCFSQNNSSFVKAPFRFRFPSRLSLLL
jgi:hypothetical protein